LILRRLRLRGNSREAASGIWSLPCLSTLLQT
jgi:hypothetical protein